MIAIVNTSPDWGIGKEGQLQVYLKEDLRRFKQLTTGKVIVYGSKTLATFPRQQPLPNRRNIVLTRQANLPADGIELCHSRDDVLSCLSMLKQTEGYTDDDFFLIGGASVYRLLLDDCDTCLVTRINRELPADAYFPDLDRLPQWVLTEEGEWLRDETSDLSFRYLTYRRRNIFNSEAEAVLADQPAKEIVKHGGRISD